MHHIKLKVNGREYEILVNAHELLADVLRDRLDLMGTKVGCGAGECGSCTVIMNGKPVNSCLVLGVQADGKEIETIEGVAHGTELHPLQKNFVKHGAIQCGFCSPGLIMTTKSMIEENPDLSEDDIREGIIGHICRCTGYQKIVEAVAATAKEIKEKGREGA